MRTVVAPERYDPQNEAEFRDTLTRRVEKGYRRDGNVIIPRGFALGFTGGNGIEYVFSVDDDNALTFGVTGSTPVSLASVEYVTTVTAGFDESIALVTSEIVAAREGETSLLAKINTVEAAIVSGDTAVAGTVTALTATVNANTASITNIAQAYATNSSASARLIWTVNTTTNAAVIEQTAATGFSDGTWNGSAITLTANEIRLNGDVFFDGTITANLLDPGSIAAIGYAYPTTGGISTGYVEKVSKSVTSDGGPVEVEFAALFELSSPLTLEWMIGDVGDQSIIIYAKIFRDTTEIVGEVEIARWRYIKLEDHDPIFTGGLVQQGRLVTVDEPAAGTYDYSVQLKCNTSGSDFGLYAAVLKDTARLFRVVNPSDGPNAISGP